MAEVGAPAAAVLYVSSVADERAGTGRALSWNEACRQATTASEAPSIATDDPWAAVQQARQEVAASAAPGI